MSIEIEQALSIALNSSQACLIHGDTFNSMGCILGCEGKRADIIRVLRQEGYVLIKQEVLSMKGTKLIIEQL